MFKKCTKQQNRNMAERVRSADCSLCLSKTVQGKNGGKYFKQKKKVFLVCPPKHIKVTNFALESL